jgi:hypothetical protein
MQVINNSLVYAWPPVNLTEEFVSDELCFSSAASLSVVSAALLMAASMVIGILL